MDLSNIFALCMNTIRCLEKFLEHFEGKSFVWNCQNRTLHIPQEFNGWLQIWIWTKKTAPPYTFVKIFFSMHPMTPILFRECLYGCKWQLCALSRCHTILRKDFRAFWNEKFCLKLSNSGKKKRPPCAFVKIFFLCILRL